MWISGEKVNMYTRKAAKKATKQDRKLLLTVHPYSARVMELLKPWDVIHIPSVGAILNRPDLIRNVFLDKTHYSKIGEGVSSSLWTPIIGVTGLLNMDGDTHVKLRRELAGSFSQKVIPELVNKVFSTYIETKILALQSGGTIDVAEITAEIAYRSLWELLGFPETDDENYKEETVLLRSVTEGVDLHRKTLPEHQIRAAREKLVFVEKLTVIAYDNNNSGIVRTMKNAGYSLEEVTSVAKSLMITGTETIISYIPRTIALFIRSGFMGNLVADRSLLDNALEESFRVTVPTPVAARSVIEPVELAGKTLQPGSRVMLATISACQKSGFFNPYKPIDKDLKGLWFGAGTHMCIGLPMAKAQTKTFMNILLSIPGVENLHITEAVISKRGHTGSYSKLLIKIKANT